MSKIMIIAGFGTGISMAVAERFGREGFTLALVARNAERLAAGAQALAAKGVRAEAFVSDLSNPEAVKAVIGEVRAKLGPISVLHWNAYMGAAGDLLTAPTAEIRALFDVPVTSLIAAVQAALPDLAAQKNSAILVTNGGLGLIDPAVDAMAVGWNTMGLAVANAAKHKAVGLLSAKLQPQAIYVGEVIVLQPVKGTSWDNGTATLEASTIAGRFWDLYSARGPVSVNVG
jgi:NAD(P)-dependent dehydrogenase (short-subunit alcohol dehydrogenase family)